MCATLFVILVTFASEKYSSLWQKRLNATKDIQGYGVGAGVTDVGVFTDIMGIASLLYIRYRKLFIDDFHLLPYAFFVNSFEYLPDKVCVHSA